MYEGLLLEMQRSVFQNALGAEVFRRYLRHSPATALVLLDLSARPDDPWWRDGRDRAIEEALRQTVRDLERRLGTDRRGWRGGRVHPLAPGDPLGGVAPPRPRLHGPAP